MKKNIIYLIFLCPIFVFCQKNNSKLDTIFYEDVEYYKNGKIKLLSYKYRIPFLDGSNNKQYTKEDLFIRGLGSGVTNRVDSFRIYKYDNNWDLIEEKVVIGNQISKEVTFDKDEYNLLEKLVSVQGKVGSIKTIDLKPDEYDLFTIENDNEGILIEQIGDSVKSVEVFPRFNLSIPVASGINTYDIYVEGEINPKTKMKMEVIGFDIANSDFRETKTQAIENALIFKSRAEVYIEKQDNEHLLEVRKKGLEKSIMVTTSKVVNTLNLKSLEKGEYLLELINLNTGRRRYCKMIVK